MAQQNGTANGSPGESGSDNGDDNDDDNDEVENEANSDDELTRRINAQAKDLEEPEEEKEIEWSVDMSEAAIKARAQELPEDLKRALVIEGEDADAEAGPYDVLGKWIIEQAQAKGSVAKVEDVEIYLKAKELGIETKHRTLAVLAQTIFDDNIIKQIAPRSGMLKRMITSDKHEKALLGGTERLVGIENPKLISQVSGILLQYYQNDLVSEEQLKAFGSKASKKYVDISTSKKVRKSAEKFIEWLETAESDDEDEESDDE